MSEVTLRSPTSEAVAVVPEGLVDRYKAAGWRSVTASKEEEPATDAPKRRGRPPKATAE